jgi:hypothetical protein
MKFRKLRIAWSVGWGLFALLLCLLWVRSYWWLNQAQYKLSNTESLVVLSAGGTVSAAAMGSRAPIVSSFYSAPITDAEIESYQRIRWQFTFSRFNKELRVPTWFAVLVCGSIVAIPWLPVKRFSLRTLLIVTTLVAVVLGLVVWARR